MFQEQVELVAKIREPGNLQLQTANRKPQFRVSRKNFMLKVRDLLLFLIRKNRLTIFKHKIRNSECVLMIKEERKMVPQGSVKGKTEEPRKQILHTLVNGRDYERGNLSVLLKRFKDDKGSQFTKC